MRKKKLKSGLRIIGSEDCSQMYDRITRYRSPAYFPAGVQWVIAPTGFLTCPRLRLAFSDTRSNGLWPVFYDSSRGPTAAGTVPDSDRIPFSERYKVRNYFRHTQRQSKNPYATDLCG